MMMMVMRVVVMRMMVMVVMMRMMRMMVMMIDGGDDGADTEGFGYDVSSFLKKIYLFVYLFIGSIVHLLCNQSRCGVPGTDMTSFLP